MLMKSLVSTAIPLGRRVIAMNTPCLTAMPRRLAHDVPAHFLEPTMDEMAVPCGSWQEHYDNKQRKYNIFLISSLGFFIISVFAIYSAGALDFHASYPPPAPRL